MSMIPQELFIGATVAFLVAAHYLHLTYQDKKRIRKYLAKRGCKVHKIKWAPFGRGWMAKGRNQIYLVRYTDAQQVEHRVHCATSWLGGVYFADDIVTKTEVIKVRDDRCSHCGYSLIGNTSGKCPECGTPAPDAVTNDSPA